MGRLQRKKPAFRPKNKPNAGQSVDSNAARSGATAANTNSSATSAALEEKKRRVPASAKPLTPSRAYPGRQHVDKAIQFLREVRVELKKVTWPSRKQTVGSTVVVIVLVLIIAFFLGAVDVGLSGLVRMVLN